MFRLFTSFIVVALFSVPAGFAAGGEVILPRLKPALFRGNEATVQPPARAKPINILFPKGNGAWSADQVGAAEKRCRTLLATLDIAFRPLGALGEEGSCGTASAILISAIAGVRIEPPAEANCAFAEALHHWIA